MTLPTLPDLLLTGSLGLAAGTASMLVYARFSPQKKLRGLKDEMRHVKQQLADYDGDFAGAMALSQQNLRLSLRSLGCVLWPSLLAGLPVLVALPWFGTAYVTFFVAVAVAALATKFKCNIA